MSKKTVVGSAPIAFTTKEGKAVSIPLSALSFGDNGLDIPASYEEELQKWLKYLDKTGALKPSEKTEAQPAIAIVAKNSGKAGNNIKIEFKDIQKTVDPVNSTFTAIITATEIYDLSFDKNSTIFIKKVLGLTTLINVKGTATESTPKQLPYQLENGDDATKSTKAVESEPSGTAFTIEAKNKGKDGNDINIEISKVNTTAKTYTLTAIWNPTFKDIKLGDLPAELQGLQDIIEVTKPEGSEFAIPDAGVVVLNGGADKQDAIAAKAIATATVFAN
jgi:hypothetical protein